MAALADSGLKLRLRSQDMAAKEAALDALMAGSRTRLVALLGRRGRGGGSLSHSRDVIRSCHDLLTRTFGPTTGCVRCPLGRISMLAACDAQPPAFESLANVCEDI